MKIPLAALTLLLASSVMAAPAQVIIIRHGEKPETGNELDPQGRQRAQLLVGFFENNPAVTQYGTPAAIYAMAPGGPDGSLRPIQTVTPLVNDLKTNNPQLPFITTFTKLQGADAVSDIMNNPAYDGKMVLICWEHKAIPGLAQDFGYDAAPTKWQGGDFSSVWMLNFTGDKMTGFKIMSEHVLPNDP